MNIIETMEKNGYVTLYKNDDKDWDRVKKALELLTAIADAYDDNALDDEARKLWGKELEYENKRALNEIVLYSGRGGKELLTLADCMFVRG